MKLYMHFNRFWLDDYDWFILICDVLNPKQRLSFACFAVLRVYCECETFVFFSHLDFRIYKFLERQSLHFSASDAARNIIYL